MKELQQFARTFQREMNFHIDDETFESARTSLLNNYMLLTTEVAEVAEELRKGFNLTYQMAEEGMDQEAAFEKAKDSIRTDVGKELADCIAYIAKIANYFEVDLEKVFYEKMEEVRQRKNKDSITPVKNK